MAKCQKCDKDGAQKITLLDQTLCPECVRKAFGGGGYWKYTETTTPAVSLRDQFAMAAVSGLATPVSAFESPLLETPKTIAVWAYDVADAMLKARETPMRLRASDRAMLQDLRTRTGVDLVMSTEELDWAKEVAAEYNKRGERIPRHVRSLVRYWYKQMSAEYRRVKLLDQLLEEG